jgi:hypothetical protein
MQHAWEDWNPKGRDEGDVGVDRKMLKWVSNK